jgi:hypothetical protein
MPIVRYVTVVGSALLVFLFVSDAYFGDESNSRFNGSLYESATYVPRVEEAATVAELRFTRDASPADHVREVFAQFVANDGRRVRR